MGQSVMGIPVEERRKCFYYEQIVATEVGATTQAASRCGRIRVTESNIELPKTQHRATNTFPANSLGMLRRKSGPTGLRQIKSGEMKWRSMVLEN
jgi:hypothetical protein